MRTISAGCVALAGLKKRGYSRRLGTVFGIILTRERIAMSGKTTTCALARDILERNVPEEVLAVLLKDRSTGRNRECGKEAS